MDLIIKSSTRLHPEKHGHLCEVCKRGNPKGALHTESNEVCQKTLRGTGLDYHSFPCMNHCAYLRSSFGLDHFIDALIDDEQAKQFKQVWTDEKAEQRENGELSNSDG